LLLLPLIIGWAPLLPADWSVVDVMGMLLDNEGAAASAGPVDLMPNEGSARSGCVVERSDRREAEPCADEPDERLLIGEGGGGRIDRV
jgi:hypothetical protein